MTTISINRIRSCLTYQTAPVASHTHSAKRVMWATRTSWKSRRPNDDFSVTDLIRDLTPHARDKACTWDWECACYSKRRRSQAADREGLEKYAPLLRIILQHAPGGLPSLVRLREVWLHLHKAYGIMADDLAKTSTSPEVWANECGDLVRLMLSHLKELKSSGTTFVTPVVASLMDGLVVLPISTSKPAPPSPTKDVPITEAPPDSQESCSSVVFCSATCCCPDCVGMAAASQESDVSSSSVAAMKLTDAVLAGKGAVKALVRQRALDGKLYMQPARKKPAAAIIKDLVKPANQQAKLVHAKKKGAAYILLNKTYFIGLSSTVSSRYLDIMKELLELCKSGIITSKADAKTHVQNGIMQCGSATDATCSMAS